ncbi:MAG: PTS sugar transporter subunit IIA [Thiohalocapsa sp.]|nr:PTS sugar transporter subunit IIA [Thiohalocapsa sp.]MCF7990301.1 PTS sugar transporter subunit IIA [Thiohalocapsa sp.]
MFPPNLITETRVVSRCDVSSKKRLLETLAELLAGAQPQLTSEHIFDRLLERERLGSTGLGHGIALPHARVAEVEDALGAFVQLRTGVPFDAIDDRPVDLAFALLVPESADQRHLQLLAGLAEMFNDERLREHLRNGESPADLLQLMRRWETTASTL